MRSRKRTTHPAVPCVVDGRATSRNASSAGITAVIVIVVLLAVAALISMGVPADTAAQVISGATLCTGLLLQLTGRTSTHGLPR